MFSRLSFGDCIVCNLPHREAIALDDQDEDHFTVVNTHRIETTK